MVAGLFFYPRPINHALTRPPGTLLAAVNLADVSVFVAALIGSLLVYFFSSLAIRARSGLTVKSHFDLKPGTYTMRAVVRDSEGGRISGLNRTVEIPY